MSLATTVLVECVATDPHTLSAGPFITPDMHRMFFEPLDTLYPMQIILMKGAQYPPPPPPPEHARSLRILRLPMVCVSCPFLISAPPPGIKKMVLLGGGGPKCGWTFGVCGGRV